MPACVGGGITPPAVSKQGYCSRSNSGQRLHSALVADLKHTSIISTSHPTLCTAQTTTKAKETANHQQLSPMLRISDALAPDPGPIALCGPAPSLVGPAVPMRTEKAVPQHMRLPPRRTSPGAKRGGEGIHGHHLLREDRRSQWGERFLNFQLVVQRPNLEVPTQRIRA